MWVKEVKSELEKVPVACEEEVPQTQPVRGEKLMTVMWEGKGN